jgi:hypothetical protein
MRTPPFLLVACAYFIQTTDIEAGPLDVWEKHPRPENSPPLLGVAFANDLFVAVGSGLITNHPISQSAFIAPPIKAGDYGKQRLST